MQKIVDGRLYPVITLSQMSATCSTALAAKPQNVGQRGKARKYSPAAPSLRDFTVRYVFRQNGRNYTGQTVWQGETRKSALATFNQEFPHLLTARIV